MGSATHLHGLDPGEAESGTADCLMRLSRQGAGRGRLFTRLCGARQTIVPKESISKQNDQERTERTPLVLQTKLGAHQRLRRSPPPPLLPPPPLRSERCSCGRASFTIKVR